MIRMIHYCQRQPDGSIHVQNAVMGHLGQHHVHTSDDFDRWTKDASGKIEWLEGCQPCDCGLAPGERKAGS